MAKLYVFAGEWYVPGKQPRGASKTDVPGSPAELAEWLNARRVRIVPSQFEAAPEAAAAEPVQERPTRSLSLEDEWEALPLPLQLHFAALAVERARDEIKPGRGQ